MIAAKAISPSDILQIRKEAIIGCIKYVSRKVPQRKEPAKSTFFVPVEQHHELDAICEILGLTKQEIYSKALNDYLNNHIYLNDIPPESLQKLLPR